MYKCPGCGAGLRFDPKKQSLVCDHCAREIPSTEFNTLKNNLEAAEHENVIPEYAAGNSETYESVVYTCPSCGANVLSTDEAAITFCNYCGSSVVLEKRLETIQKPARIIPFSVGKEDCEAIYKKALKKAIFAPSYMKSDVEIEKFRGIYMPHWIYSFGEKDELVTKGKKEHRRGDYVITEHYRVSQNIDMDCSGIAFDASSQFADEMSLGVAPFLEKDGEDFELAYMAGFYADVSNVQSDVYAKDALDAAKTIISEKIYEDPAYRASGVDESEIEKKLDLAAGEEKLGLFPVWFLASRHKKENRISYGVVNGQTGKIAAEFPVAFWKYILGSVVLAIPIFLLLNIGLTLSPMICTMITTALSLIGLIVLNSQLNKAYGSETKLNDRGLQSTVQESEDAGGKQSAKTGSKSSLPLILGVIGAGIAFVIYYVLDAGASKIPWALVIGGVGLLLFVIFCIVNTISKNRGAAVKRVKVKAPFSKKMKLLKPIIGIVVSIIVMIINPTEDWFFYGAVILSALLMVWTMYDAVVQHNHQTTHKPPQFNKRGGDLNA